MRRDRPPGAGSTVQSGTWLGAPSRAALLWPALLAAVLAPASVGCGDNLAPQQRNGGGVDRGAADDGGHPAWPHLTAGWRSGATGAWPASGAGATDVWVVGELGTIVHRGGGY
ncbi:MAG: hypothetical protein HY906_19670 [Deltaproteobacteria bacterium]|nr:hypothetical protein [Deltaproteobacteria bacterium]